MSFWGDINCPKCYYNFNTLYLYIDSNINKYYSEIISGLPSKPDIISAGGAKTSHMYGLSVYIQNTKSVLLYSFFIPVVIKNNNITSCCSFATTTTKRTFPTNLIGPHKYDIICLIFGILLGDAYAEKRAKGTRICFSQEHTNMEYLHYTWKIFSDSGYCSIVVPSPKKRIGSNGKIRFVYRFNSYTYASFNWIYESFYVNGTKIVPLNMADYLSPLALAHWIMDDGTKTADGIRIATNSFSKSDVDRLCLIVLQKYGIKASAVKNNYDVTYLILLDPKLKEISTQYNVYIHKCSMPELIKLVKPYFVKSMYYKLGL